ncbi:MAG: hypothetical protein ABEJ23_02165 [Haloarculaceae archaeon]
MDVAGVAHALGLTVEEAAVGLAASIGLAAFIMVALRYEAELPFLVSLLFVPVVVASGFTFALVVRFWLSISILESAGVLGGVMILLIAVYEGLKLFASDPPPPSTRY